MHYSLPLLLVLFAAFGGTSARAQGGDPAREIQEIARRVDEQLREIDQLLLDSSKKNQARTAPKDLLQQAQKKGEAVETGIDELIQKLTEMKNQGGGGQSQDQQNQEPKDPQGQPKPGQQQGQSTRRENQTPDFVQQPQRPGEQQPGQQEGQKPQGQQPGQEQPQPQGQPQGGQEAPGPGENTRGNRPPESETGPGQPGQGEGTWGELQPYVNFLKNKGSAPKVPEKYRKYYEAYLKSKPGSTTGSGGK